MELISNFQPSPRQPATRLRNQKKFVKRSFSDEKSRESSSKSYILSTKSLIELIVLTLWKRVMYSVVVDESSYSYIHVENIPSKFSRNNKTIPPYTFKKYCLGMLSAGFQQIISWTFFHDNIPIISYWHLLTTY